MLAEQLGGVPRAEVVAEIERGLLELYRDPALNEKPALLEQRGGAFYSEAATGLVASLVTSDGVVHEVDVRNDGTLAGLADDDVVEVPARVEDGRLVPLPQAPLAPELLGLTQHVAAYERLAAQAAVTADPALARKALLAHPLIGQHPLNEELVELLLDSRERGAEGTRVTRPIVLAVDGGNSKTRSCARRGRRPRPLARTRAAELAAPPRRRRQRRGARASLPTRRWTRRASATRTACRSPRSRDSAWRESTSPPRRRCCRSAIAQLGWAEATSVANDTFAVLRAGTESGWGVAVVCGAGINCVGVAPGRTPGALRRRSASSAATGAAATTSAWPRSLRRRAARTAAAPRPPSSEPFRPTSAWARRRS